MRMKIKVLGNLHIKSHDWARVALERSVVMDHHFVFYWLIELLKLGRETKSMF